MPVYAGREINHIESRRNLRCGNHGWVSCCLSAEKNSIIWGYGGMVDAVDLKSIVFETCRFKSGYPYWWKLDYIFHGSKSESKLSHMPRHIRKAVTNFKWRNTYPSTVYIFSFVFVIIYTDSVGRKLAESSGQVAEWQTRWS